MLHATVLGKYHYTARPQPTSWYQNPEFARQTSPNIRGSRQLHSPRGQLQPLPMPAGRSAHAPPARTLVSQRACAMLTPRQLQGTCTCRTPALHLQVAQQQWPWQRKLSPCPPVALTPPMQPELVDPVILACGSLLNPARNMPVRVRGRRILEAQGAALQCPPPQRCACPSLDTPLSHSSETQPLVSQSSQQARGGRTRWDGPLQ